MSRTTDGEPTRKSAATGAMFVILGLIGLVIAGQAYPTWGENRDLLEWKEAAGVDTAEDHEIVERQTIAVLAGFFLGVPIMMIGFIAIILAMRHNSKLDAMVIEKALALYAHQMSSPSPQPPPHCPHCGVPMSNPRYCRACGRLAHEQYKG